jgi:hypothetical protein
MLKNPQKHWDFAKCAGLRMVISLSAMRARAWKTTKIPPATLRTRLIHEQSVAHVSSPVRCSIESFRTHGCSSSIGAGCRIATSRHQPAFESRTTLRTYARSQPSCPLRRTSNTTRHVPTSGPTTRLPKWHSGHAREPHPMGPPWPKSSSKGPRNSSQVSESFFRLTEFWRSPCIPAISSTANGARPLPALRHGLTPTIATTRCFATRGSESLTVWSKAGETSPVKDALVTSLKLKGAFPHGNQQLAK